MWPLIAQQFRQAWREQRFHRLRRQGTGWAALFFGLALLGSYFLPDKSGLFGFRIVLLAMAVIASRTSLALAAEIFTAERRAGTLELLVLTGLRPGAIFLARLAGVLAVAWTVAGAGLPFLCLCFCLGGVTPGLFQAGVLAVLAFSLLTLAAGLVGSLFTAEEGLALISAVAVLLLMLAGAPLLLAAGLVTVVGGSFGGFVWLSPLNLGWELATRPDADLRQEFWSSLAITTAWILLLFGTATLILRWNWRALRGDGAEADLARRWRDWLAARQRAHRARLRERFDAEAPYARLAGRHRGPVVLAWAVIGIFAALPVVGARLWPGLPGSQINPLAGALLLWVSLASIRAYAEGRPIAADRRSGALEILLTTPLEPADLARGMRRALRLLFRPVSIAAAALCLAWAARGWQSHSFTEQQTMSFLAAWTVAVLAMLGLPRSRLNSMWFALVTGRALWTSMPAGAGLVLFGWMLTDVWYVLLGFPSGSTLELYVCVGAAGFYLFATACMVLRPRQFVETNRNLLEDMRAAAALPLPDLKDPRFRKWSGSGLPEFPSYPPPDRAQAH